MRTDFAAEIELTPAFHDLDPMAIVWHGHYLKYFELARCALLQKFDYDYPQMHASGFIWPIVDLRAKYVRSAQLGQKLKVRAQIVEWEYRLKIEYLIRDAMTDQVLTRAYTIQVAVDLATNEMCLVSPSVLSERLGIAE
ncbi:MAG TPA: thioesterase family protein [Xanthomonadaceae bacterium]|nr:thioesterase family protein [Xanthomonadaceae bacterium]